MVINAYDQIKAPSKHMAIIGIVVSSILLGGLAGCLGSIIASNLVEDSPAAGALGLIICFGGGIAAAGVAGWMRHKKQLAAYEAAIAWQAEYWEKLNYILKEIHTSEGAWLQQQDWSQHFSLYRPKKDEVLFWIGPAAMSEQRERVDAVARIGAVKLAKLPFNSLGYANVEKVIEHKVAYEHIEGKGVLAVTNKRLIFVSNGHGANWTQAWPDLMSWQPAINAVLVQPSQGQPKAFLLDGAGREPICDTQVTTKAMELAHDNAQ